MGKVLRVLNVEDSERDVAMLTRHLLAAGYDLISERVDTPEAMKAALEAKEWDIILCDYSMPRFNALAALDVLHSLELDIPFIIISGTVGEEIAVEAMLTGANDYLPKDNLSRLIPAIERELNEAKNRSQKIQAENERRIIFEIIQGAISAPNLDEFLKLVHLSISQIVYAENCFVMLHDPASDMIHFEFWVDSRDPRPQPKPRGEGFASYVLQTGLPLRLTAESKKRLQEEGKARQVGSISASWLGVPLRTPSRTIGVLVLQHYDDEDAYSERDLEFLSSVGDQIALAIERKSAEEALTESEERYRSVVETASDAIVTIDENSTILFVNSAAERIFGYTFDEMKGSPLTMLMPQRFQERHTNGIGSYLLSGEKHLSWDYIELSGLHRDGHEIPLALSFAEFSQDGRRYFTGIISDITERKKAAQALGESEERYRDLVENAIDIIYTHDLKGNYTSVNRAAERMTGYTREESLTMNLAQTVAPGFIEKARERLAAKLAGDDVTAYELEIIAKDGHHMAVEVNTRVIYENDVPVGVQGIARDITERKKADAALKDAEERYRSIFENAVEGIFQSTPEGTCISVNPAMASILGYDSPAELIAHRRDIAAQHYVDPNCRAELQRMLEDNGVVVGFESEVFRKDGSKIWTRENMRAIRDANGKLIQYEGSIEDITEKRELEEQFRQAQKMEAVGTLAGGIAHDFNNLITAINGYSDLTLMMMSGDDPSRHFIEEIKGAGDRAATLTGQLLTFSRKQVSTPIVHNLNTVITEIQRMLRRIIRESVELRLNLDPDLGNIKADKGQMEQIIMNLSVNARDAMPGGGSLTIETRNVDLDNAYSDIHLTTTPGRYIRLTVTDTGEGIDEQTQQRIFEPFFTTKEVGKGTGLGLSTVHGIVKQSGGSISVYSEVGHGAAFKIYLPCVDEDVQKIKWIEDNTGGLFGTETVLLVEDDDVVRNLVREVLTRYGYKILEAASGKAALSICDTCSEPIHLLLTDVIMPKMGGTAIRDQVVTLLPDIKVLFMSGYTDDAIAHSGIIDSGTAFIEKPFTPDALARKVREALGS